MSMENIARMIEDANEDALVAMQQTQVAAQEFQRASEVFSEVFVGSGARDSVESRIAGIVDLFMKVAEEYEALRHSAGNYTASMGLVGIQSDVAPNTAPLFGGVGTSTASEKPSPPKVPPTPKPAPQAKPAEKARNTREEPRHAKPTQDNPRRFNLGAKYMLPQNANERLKNIANADGGFDTARGRLTDLLQGVRAGDSTDVTAAAAAASILSGDERAALGEVMKSDTAKGHARAVLFDNLDKLGPGHFNTPIEVLTLATDVINHNPTSLVPQAAKDDTAKRYSEVVAAVRGHVEAHYGVSTNDEATIGFLAECRLHDLMGKDISSDVRAGLDARLRAAWARMSPGEANRRDIAGIYYKILGITNLTQIEMPPTDNQS